MAQSNHHPLNTGGSHYGGSAASFGLQQSSYLSNNSSALNKNPLGGGLSTGGGGGGYKPSILSGLGGGNNISTSSSAGASNYLPPTGVNTGSRFGRLAQFGVMTGAGSNSTSHTNSMASQSHHNEGSVGTSSFASALGFGRHKI